MPERIVVTDPLNPHLGGNIKGGDEMTWFPELWDYLIQRFEPKSLLDVGCGEGHLMKYFHDRVIDVYGIDGLPENKTNAPESIREKITINDYTKTCAWGKDVDMVISCEFVEHVHNNFVENFLLDFMHGKIIVMTHALPGQDGYHHVNCRDDFYWIEQLGYIGYTLLITETEEARRIAEKYDKVLWKTVMIFA